MIKGEITLCGTIARTAEVKKSSEVHEFISFPVKYKAVGRDGSEQEVEITVSADGGKQSTSVFTTGRRISVKGTMTIRKLGDKLYYNLRSESEPALVSSTEEDVLEGTMHFEGKTGKKDITSRKDKKGREFIPFQGFDKGKDGSGNPEFIWFNFLLFHPTDEQKAVLKPSTWMDVDGEYSLTSYKGRLSNDVVVSAVGVHAWDDSKDGKNNNGAN